MSYTPMANINPGQVQQYLQGLNFPAEKDEIISNATEKGAGEDILGALRRLPDKSYDNTAEVNEEIGKGDTSE
ncbi:MAG: hypothetical protein UW43_C0012G0015 [Candidatus Yanofskybacteria bacterium GW2011_GWA1_44_21]|uniref:DUF2795 domain-containing protein n=3 Tax=Parcubacteria group TaxID=1794811 RepID=A0A0G1AIX1_9BACT|nr:MAG: hypothetical protein UU85_C0005G0018 [Candidatus Wolfebacteria bacterium GW2011_GWA2_42_10]KKT50099.1 MAG: hypothetical protein UW43_C0012G0015 [Candidatus Yanofskybacteria bacterium GW2011_GWA1_44_21]KKT90077.1 MAG: hypothetical protein UW90_C0007G0018 [Candidatus Yanofskybacteria bacterium GW2011_GWB1_45_11]